ncbi:hypothetical protein OUZ56_022621 [Daphnia magna]|uniref:Uncharacterized protein n=1 Tax=Daphnia magna TaxID=35525 RepID=A0ABR0AWZ1_9CRUS|nr:hypothetical protein OUZ56_022621 [Daphnia magna]
MRGSGVEKSFGNSYVFSERRRYPKTEHRILACGKWSSQSLTPLCWVYKKALLDEYRLTVEFENPARPNRTTFFGKSILEAREKKKKIFPLLDFQYPHRYRIP